MKSLFLLLLVLPVALTFGQNVGKIAGTVIDKSTKNPIPGAHILVKETKLGASTDLDGSYFILNVPVGEYVVAASIVGYQTVAQQKVIVNINKTTTIDFSLTETTVDLPEVTIVAKRPDVELDKTTSSIIVRTEDIETIASMQTVGDVLTLASDVSDGHFRGGREGEEAYNLSGMGIMNPLDNTSAFTPMVSAVGEVEVVTSGFSAQYGNAQSGIVNISMKEGQSDRWRTRAELRTRVPAYKHFGPSVFDKSANPYLNLLDTPEKWMGTDSSIGQRYYSSIGNGFDNRYGQDTVTLAQIAYTLWTLQGRRDLNRRYDNLQDYNIDVTTNGSLSSNARIFLGARIDNEWPVIPTAEPDVKRQATGNLVFDIGKGSTFRVLGSYVQDNGHIFRSAHTTGLLSWLWDRILGVNYSKKENVQLGVRYAHTVSPSTYYDIKLNSLLTKYKDGSPVTDPNGYSGGDPNKIIWGDYKNTPDVFRVGDIDDNFRDEKTRTVSFDGSLTSQMTKSHQLLAGLQANLYRLDINNVVSIMSTGSSYLEQYSANPFEIGLYAQDKMEFEGMIANIGLRWDVWNQNVEYYSDLYSPFRVSVSSSDSKLIPEREARAKTPTLGRLEPRIGFSFPVTLTTVFHLNYGSFVQRASFDRTILTHIPTDGFARIQLGNPRLHPEETNQYDLGLTQGLGEGFTVDVSGYYKDVKNLVERAYYSDIVGTVYSTYVNRDYADVRGFRAMLAKRQGFLTGSVSYTFGVATGKSSTPENAPIKFNEKTGKAELPNPKDILLDFDRTHNLIINVAINTDEKWGPTVLGAYPFERTTLSIYSFARSGRPYTYNQSGETQLMNKRAPAEYSTKMRVTKRLPQIGKTNPMVYLEVTNLFNQKIYSYSAVFQDATALTGGSYMNPNLRNYEENQAKLQYFDYDNSYPFLADQTFLLYDNLPRSISLGIVMNF